MSRASRQFQKKKPPIKRMPFDRMPRLNACEEAFNILAEAHGWQATKRGWPDFLCVKDGEYIAVEVKPRNPSGRLQYLKRDQAVTMDLLSGLGLKCFVSDGETLEPYSREKHRPPD